MRCSRGGIGAYALLFVPLVAVMERLYPAVFTDQTSPGVLVLVRALGAFLLMLVPTTLMGATLPLTTEYVHRLLARGGERARDWSAGRLYGANTFGAALGSLASGFVLIELLGLNGTTLVAAAFNFVVMAVGMRLARDAAEPVPEAEPERGAERPAATGLLLFFALSGALALTGEVVWTRALTLFLGSSTYSFSAILIAYLVGLALGSWLMAGFVPRLAAPERWLAPLALAAGAWHYLAVLCIPAMYSLADVLVGPESNKPAGAAAALSVAAFALVVVALMLPPAFLSGAMFPVVTLLAGGRSGDRGGPIARALTWNTVGAIAGALFGGFVVAPLFPHFHAIEVLALCFVGLALYGLALTRWQATGRFRAGTALAAAAVAAAALFSLGRPDLFIALVERRLPQFEVRHHESGLQGVTSVIEQPGREGPSARLLVNGIGMTVKVFATKAMAHLPILAHGDAEDTLVLCFGMGTTFRSALSHGGRVDVVELSPGVIDAFDCFYPDAAAVRADPRGRVIVDDARNFLLMTPKLYDVITADPPPPIDGAGVNHLYSREFCELVRAHLAPGGIAQHWIPSPTPQNGIRDMETLASLIATFTDVFPHVRAFGAQRGVGLHLLGSMTPFALDPARVEAALADPRVRADLDEFPWDAFDPAVFTREERLPKSFLEGARLLTDDRPFLEFNLLRSLARGMGHTLLRVSP